MGTIYLLHFDQPISDRHTCQHYIGYTSGALSARIEAHQTGQGARLTAVAAERGITFQVARTWTGNRTDERRLKNGKRGPRLCPICAAQRTDKELNRHDRSDPL